MRDQPVVARARLRRVELVRRGGRVDPDVRVMHHFRIPRPELQRANVPDRVGRNRQHEDSKDIRAVRRQRVRLRQRDDDIRFAELPAFCPRAHRRKIARISLGRALVCPPANQPDLGVGKGLLTDKRSIRRIGLPRRHVTALGHARDERRASLDILVRQQTEGRRPARVMAHAAAIGDEGRDVLRVGDRLRRGARTKKRARQREQDPLHHESDALHHGGHGGHGGKDRRSAMGQSEG